MMLFFLDRIGNIIGQGENATDSLPNCINFRLVQNESICRRQIKCSSNKSFSDREVRKHSVKRRKCWLPALKSTDCSVED